jgi:hypothetical protein
MSFCTKSRMTTGAKETALTEKRKLGKEGESPGQRS